MAGRERARTGPLLMRRLRPWCTDTDTGFGAGAGLSQSAPRFGTGQRVGRVLLAA